jgi:hypothetical protein
MALMFGGDYWLTEALLGAKHLVCLLLFQHSSNRFFNMWRGFEITALDS